LVDHIADEQRTSQMRHDEVHARARGIVNQAAGFPAQNVHMCGTCCRLIQDCMYAIHKVLRRRPLFVATRFDKFVVGHEVCRAQHPPGPEKEHCRSGRLELRVLVQIVLRIVRFDAEFIVDMGGLAHRVAREQSARLSAHEFRHPAKHINPQRAIERRVVDIIDQRGQLLSF
jgi:hypothetical protein